MNYYLASSEHDIKISCGKVEPRYNSGRRQWIADGISVATEPGDYQVIAEPEEEVGNLQPSLMEFLLLLTLVEQAAIRAAAPNDPQVGILISMVDDPRLTFVDLTHPTVIEAIQYLAGKPALLTADRAARILAGLPPKAAE